MTPKLTPTQRDILNKLHEGYHVHINSYGNVWAFHDADFTNRFKFTQRDIASLLKRGLIIEDEQQRVGYIITDLVRSAIAPKTPEPKDERTLEQRLTSGDPADRTIGRHEVHDAIDLVMSGKVQPIEGRDFVRMPAPEPPASSSAALTEIERDLLHTISIWPLPLRFADHLKPESLKAFESLRDRGLIKLSGADDLYRLTDAGRRALESAKGGKS